VRWRRGCREKPLTVILLHGLGRTPLSLTLAQLHLRRAGFEPVSIGYPSRSQPIEELAELVRSRLPADRDGEVHFVTHSMGGIVARRLLSVDPPPDLGRVVMLSPPNRGSKLATRLRNNPLFRALTGPSGQQIGDDPGSVPNRLPPADFELGVITGNRDAKVTVDEATVDGMTDFLVVPHGHTFIMNYPGVLDQVVHFLRHGHFARD